MGYAGLLAILAFGEVLYAMGWLDGGILTAFVLFVVYTGQLALEGLCDAHRTQLLPASVYAVALVRAGTAAKEIEEGMSADHHYVRKYSTQELIIFAPIAVLLLAVGQELTKKTSAKA